MINTRWFSDGFVMGLLSVNTNYPPHEAAENVKELLGYEMVSYCDALFGIWKPYEAREGEATK